MGKRKIEIWGVLAILSGQIAAAGAPQALSEGRQVLPRTLVPSRYELSLIPNAEALTFKGTVQITGDAPTGGRQIVVNAKGLTFDEVRLDGQQGTVALDDKLGRAALTFPSAFAAGRHTLSVAYHGPITTGTIGFFAMD
jgi:aminopeptidase N